MSTSVDSRVATMKFDNKQFESGAAQSLSTLQKLKQSLNFDNAAKGLDGLKNVSSKFKFGGVGEEVDAVKNKFSALQVAGVAAIATIASKATSMGLNMAKSLTLDPVKAGFDEYELKMGSIQTILSNTARYGTKLPEVTARLDELNTYADKTIYNFGDMTKNIGLFTNAGIRIGDATSMIKGFSNEAAASGTNAQGAASAAYQLSQALSAGTIRLMDWRSLQNVGMGNKNMQNGLVELADTMGELDKAGTSSKEVLGSFNESLEKKWLSADVMSKYLKIMAGDMSVAEQKAMGLTDAQIKMFKTQQKNAEDSATKVRTFTQLVGTIRESIGSGWAETFGIILGDFNQATKLFTGINNAVSDSIGKMSDSRNELLTGWQKLGGRQDLIKGIGNLFKALGAIIKPIGQAFREIFPPMTAKTLADLTEKFRKFTEGLILSKDSSNDIRSVFVVLFGAIKFGLVVIGGIIKYFVEFAKLLGRLIPGVLDIAGAIGELVSGLFGIGDATSGVKGLFDGVIKGREKLLGPILDWVNGLLHGFAGLIRSGADVFINKVGDAIAWAAPYFKIAKDAVEGFVNALKDKLGQVDVSGLLNDLKGLGAAIAEWFKSIFSGLDIGDAFAGLGDSIMASLGKVDIGSMFAGVGGAAKTEAKGLAGAFNIGNSADNAVAKIREVNEEMKPLERVGLAAKNVWEGLVAAFGRVADFLRPIGAAIGKAFGWLRDQISGFVSGMGIQDALAVVNTGFFIAVYVLFMRFTKKMGGVADSLSGMFDEAGGVFKGLSKNLNAMQRDVNANALLKIAGAVAILAASIFLLAMIEPKKIVVGLGAIATMGVILTKMLKSLGFDEAASKEAFAATAQMTALSIALVALSTSLLIMSAAIAVLGNMDMATIAKGLGSVALILLVVTTATSIMAKTGGGAAILAASVAIGILAISLTVFAGAIKLYESISFGTLAEGAAKIAAVLVLLGIAMQFFPPSIMGNAAALIVVSGAIVVLAGALKILGGLDLWALIKGLGAMGIALVLMANAAWAMTGAAAGAGAMILMAVAIRILAGAMVVLGSMDLWSIIKALIAIAGVFAVIGIAALVMTPIIPIIVALGLAIGVLGIAMLAAGAGMFLFATAFALLAASGAAGVATLTATVLGLASIFPLVMQQIGLGMRAFAQVIKREGPGVIQALGVVLRALLREIAKSSPQFGRTLLALLRMLLQVIWNITPQFVKTGIRVIMEFLRGIRQNAKNMAREGVRTIQEFLSGINERMGKLVDAGIKTIISFVRGVAKGIRENKKEMSDAGQDLGKAIGEGVVQGLKDMLGAVGTAAKNLGKKALDGLKDIGKIFSPSRVTRGYGNFMGLGLALGMTDQARNVERSAEDMGRVALDTMKSSVSRISAILANDLNTTPTITPVLDLSGLQKDANKMSSIFSANPLSAEMSLSGASAISAADRASKDDSSQPVQQITKEIKFEQHNHSPVALSNIRIYRDTRSLFAMAKEELETQ